MPKDHVTLRIHRFDPAGRTPSRRDEFLVPFSKGLTVVDALIYVYENVDASLAFRWSCKNVQCGTCGVKVNGIPCLACERQLGAGETVEIDPLPLPIVKDLVTDFSSIEDKRVRTVADLLPAGRPDLLKPEEISPLISLNKCLDCHICDVICPLNKGKERIEPGSFLPSDLVQLASLHYNKREGENRRETAYSKKVYHCLTCRVCVDVCPVDIDIVDDAIERLRQDFVERDREPYRKLFNPKEWVERWVEPKGDPFLAVAEPEYTVKKPKERVGLFVGCLMNRRQQDLASLAIELLNRHQMDVVVPKNQKCCGYPLARIGMVEEAKELLNENVATFEETEVTRVVTACPDCSYSLRKDFMRLVGSGDGKPRFEVSDLISVLTTPSKHKTDVRRIACHNPCYLSRQGINLATEMERRGFQVSQVIDDCCGAGGGVYFTHPDLAEEITRQIANAVESDLLITGCPFCKEQIEKVLGGAQRAVHYIEAFTDSPGNR